jgi:tRNA1Val (adenine37-N6)-methyltransferase
MAFRFKQFSIVDNDVAMKVGTDSVILGAWANFLAPTKILDVGAGSGILSLMLAQRYSEVEIFAIEIDKLAYENMKINFSESPWGNRVHAYHSDFIDFESPHLYDGIISNPPFFAVNTSLGANPRTLARQSISLSPERLMQKAASLLDLKGVFSLIFPFDQRQYLIKLAWLNNLYLFAELQINDHAGGDFKRSIFQFSKIKPSLVYCSNLCLRKSDRSFSAAFKKLTESFYLDLSE